jgi:hypothetical protein
MKRTFFCALIARFVYACLYFIILRRLRKQQRAQAEETFPAIKPDTPNTRGQLIRLAPQARSDRWASAV